ncbi:MAG: hypothetical protein IKA25_02610 [Alphaproteobacteria bacterium]|nr:hypothetical protein [Alphaproteobacteria bacterium]
MKFNLFIIFSALFASFAHANTVMSKYGVIQNVQDYSSNPFWNPNGPYNQRFPTAVYATGPSVETSDCQNVVSYLVAAECANRNKCITTQLSDIRPAIILQLSQMPNGNYASSCGGYIDTAFEQYLKTNAIAAPSAGAAFPTATGMGTMGDGSKFEMQNPLSPKLQEWQMEILDRKQELKDLQAANGVKQPKLVRTTEFPTTYADLSFTERMENAAAGYAPFKDARAYKEIEVENIDSQVYSLISRSSKSNGAEPRDNTASWKRFIV